VACSVFDFNIWLDQYTRTTSRLIANRLRADTGLSEMSILDLSAVRGSVGHEYVLEAFNYAILTKRRSRSVSSAFTICTTRPLECGLRPCRRPNGIAKVLT
jgi:hypothetical protein